FRVGAGIEAGVESAVWVYASNMIAHACAAATAAESGEKSANYDFAVRLNRQRIDNVIRTGIKDGVHAAVRGESSDMLACGCTRSATAESGESSTDYDLAVGLHRQRFHIAVRARVETIDSGLRSPLFCQQHHRHQQCQRH